MVYPHGQGGGGLSQYGQFADKGGEESNFCDFFADIFYGRPPIQQSWLVLADEIKLFSWDF